jgi:hypothetical protein
MFNTLYYHIQRAYAPVRSTFLVGPELNQTRKYQKIYIRQPLGAVYQTQLEISLNTHRNISKHTRLQNYSIT